VSEDTRTAALRLDYERTLQTYTQLAEIRFKLLAFVPTISGAAVSLLSASRIDDASQLLISLAGLVATLGVIVYDQRNSAFYNGAIGRAKHLERLLDLPTFENDPEPGLFGSRGEVSKRLLGLPISHGMGTALIYAPAIGLWTFAAAVAVTPSKFAAGIGAVGTVCAWSRLLVLDGQREWLVSVSRKATWVFRRRRT
jgi:hypothetical protein